MSLPTDILAPDGGGDALSYGVLATATSTTSNTPPPPTTTIAPPTTTPAQSPTHSPVPSLIDPPAIAGITVGAIFAAVLTFCLVGALFHFLSNRRRAKARLMREKGDGRWGSDNPQHPPEGDSRGHSADIQPPDVFQAYPKMVDSPTAGHRIDPSTIGMAVSKDPDMDVEITPASYRSTSSMAHLVSSKRKAPPSFDMPLNHLGAPLTRARCSPRRGDQTLVRAASNAQARLNVPVTNNRRHVRKITPEDLMKPLPTPRAELDNIAEARAPQTNNGSQISHPHRQADFDLTQEEGPALSPLLACFFPGSWMPVPSPIASAVPSSNLEGPSAFPKPITPTNPHPVQSIRSNTPSTRFSVFSIASRASTSFESVSSNHVTPEEKTYYISPHTSPIQSRTPDTPISPLEGLRYPRIPRSTGDRVPRSLHATAMKSPTKSAEDDTLSPLPGSAHTPQSASSAIYSQQATNVPRQRIKLNRINTSPAHPTASPSHAKRSPQTAWHTRGASQNSAQYTATTFASCSSARSTPATPWSAGCGIIEVALRSPAVAGFGSIGNVSPSVEAC